jgi:ketosteroid isomerase-like protein
MRRCHSVVWCFLAATRIIFAQTPAAPAAKMDADECAVWRRELSFAGTVENHDAKAFTSFILPGAVFDAGTANAVRGRDAVLKAWTSLIEGKEVRLRWHPDVVNIGGDRNIAISHGPFVIEDLRPGAKPKYRVGTFNTIWTRQPASGNWMVLFDGGGTPPTEVPDAKAAEDFLARARDNCPAR